MATVICDEIAFMCTECALVLTESSDMESVFNDLFCMYGDERASEWRHKVMRFDNYPSDREVVYTIPEDEDEAENFNPYAECDSCTNGLVNHRVNVTVFAS